MLHTAQEKSRRGRRDMMNNIILKMNHITKEFPGVVALNDVNFEVAQGEIHALVGENGAGKSTLMKILGGVHMPDKGTIEINEKQVEINSPSDSMAHRIGIIYQEFNLVQTLDVAENIFLGHEITKLGGKMNRKEMYKRSQSIMEQLGIKNFDCRKKVRDLSVAMQQLVEIGKAIFNDISILVMDEPTAVLTDRETENLFKLILTLKEKGLTVIYISHRLEEIVRLCDRITVLRDGCYIDTLENRNRNIDKDLIISKMVGRELSNYYPQKIVNPSKEARLEVENLSSPGVFKNISFKVNRGETLGFSGLVGAGRSEIMKALFGALPKDSGDIYIDDEKVYIRTPGDAIKYGLALVPEDRKREGINLGMSMTDNICMASHDNISVAGHFIKRKRKELVDKFFNGLSIRPADPGRLAKNFSGGNQQKGVVAKWLATKPKVIILDEPTRGIDVGAKAEIYEIINQLTAEGMAVIVVSSELPELIGICDRIIVIRDGEISGEFSRNSFDQNEILKAATN
jgi:ABC-type sugar transport system ATPase subunit